MTFKLPVNCPFCEGEVTHDWSEYIVDQDGVIDKLNVVGIKQTPYLYFET